MYNIKNVIADKKGNDVSQKSSASFFKNTAMSSGKAAYLF